MAAGDTDPLAPLLRALERTRDTAEAVDIAKRIGVVIGLPYPSCIADYSDPLLTRAPDGRSYAELFGWGKDFREDWERNRLNLISPIANVCRYSTRPFIWRSRDVVAMEPLATDTRGKHWHLTPERQIAGGLTVPVHLPLGRVGEPRDIAGAVIFLASRAGAFVSGETILVDGGRSKLVCGTDAVMASIKKSPID